MACQNAIHPVPVAPIIAVNAQWLSTGFMLTMAVVIPTTGYLLNRLSPVPCPRWSCPST